MHMDTNITFHLCRLALAAVRHGRPGPGFTPSELKGCILRVTPIAPADRVRRRAPPAVTCHIHVHILLYDRTFVKS